MTLDRHDDWWLETYRSRHKFYPTKKDPSLGNDVENALIELVCGMVETSAENADQADRNMADETDSA